MLIISYSTLGNPKDIFFLAYFDRMLIMSIRMTILVRSPRVLCIDKLRMPLLVDESHVTKVS